MIRKLAALLILVSILLPFADVANIRHLVNKDYTFTIIAAVLLLIGAILMVIDRSRKKLPDRFVVPKDGILKVKVLGVARGLKTSENQKQFYHIIAEGDDGKGHKMTFTSEPLDAYPGKQVIGANTEVIFNSHDPEDYLLKTDKLLK